MGADKKIGISKEQRAIAERYSKRTKLYDYDLVLNRTSGKRTLYFIGTDENDIVYRVRFDKVKKMRLPKGSQVVNRKDYLIYNSGEIHGVDKFNLSLVEEKDINRYDKITIICETHGEFKKTVAKFITERQGCPMCSKNRFNNNRKYFKTDENK